MSDTFLWLAGNITDPSGMSSTSNFNNGSVNDKSNGELVTSSSSIDPSVDITGMIVFDSFVTLTSWNITIGSLLPVGGSPISNTTLWRVQYYDGASWITLDSNSYAPLGASGSGYTSFGSFSGTTSVVASRIRVYVAGSLHTLAPHIIATGISDFRATHDAHIIPVPSFTATPLSLLGNPAVRILGTG